MCKTICWASAQGRSDTLGVIHYIPAIILVKKDNVLADVESPKTKSYNRDVLCRAKLITEVIARCILGMRHHIL